MTPRRLAGILAALVAGAALVLVGIFIGGHPRATGLTRLPDPARELVLGDSGTALTDQVLGVLRDDYYRDVDPQRLERESVDALVRALEDPYTDYLSPDELAALRRRTQGIFYVGVGVQLADRGGRFVIARVYEGGPAAGAGIREGARIIAVGTTPAARLTLEGVVARVRGPEGTRVTLGVAGPGREPARRVRLTRAEVTAPSVEVGLRTVGGTPVAYARLLQFTRGAGDDLRAGLAGLRERGPRATVLDLRGDPGGLVSEALSVASAFLPADTPVVVTEGAHSPRRTLRTDREPVSPDGPLVLLVDRGSASASEIVAGALRDGRDARLVGTRTFGKALVQSTVPLRDGGALKLTTARYLTPSGFDLAARGLPPDVRVVDLPATARDEALDRALRVAVGRG